MSRHQIREERERGLIADFPTFLAAFTDRPAFTRVDQLEGHRQTIKLRRGHTSIESLFDDELFVGSLHSTLQPAA